MVEAVLHLELPYRDVILCRFYEELPPRDIAKRLDLPVETVKTRLKRGLQRLRALLDAELGANDGRSWCLALLPMAGWKPGASAAASAGMSLSLPGVIAMSVKMKLGLAAAAESRGRPP